MEEKEILGVDIGGVILDFIPYFNTELDFGGENYLQTPAIADAIESLAELNRSKFKDQIYLVSRYNKEHGAGRIVEWLHYQEFFAKTGIPETHYHPCVERHEKAAICAELGVTHFIDDRAEVLSHLVRQVEHLYLFQGLDEDTDEFNHLVPGMIYVQTWKDLLQELLK